METCSHCCIKIKNVTAGYGTIPALENINLHINCGQILAVIGPNGAGKTTLLRAILGEMPYQGSMSFLIRGAPTSRPRIGYVPQKMQFDADTPVTVLDFMALAIARRPAWLSISKKIRARINNALERVAASQLLNRTMSALSGGELQRVLLALALTPQPDILLLDEPASGVDVQGLALFYELVKKLRDTSDISIIMVTHDITGIAVIADRMIILNHRVIADDTPGAILENPSLVNELGPHMWDACSFHHLWRAHQKGIPS